MEPDVALGLLVEVHAEIARLHALEAELLVAVASPEPRVAEFLVLDPRPDRHEERLVRIADAVREEVAAALRWSPATAQARIDAARLLHGPLPQTRAALAAGEISPAHVQVLVAAAQRLSTRLDPTDAGRERFRAQCTALETRLLPTARRATVARTRQAGLRTVDRIDAAGQAARRAAARCTRDVYVGQEIDGIAPLIAHLDALTARAVLAAVRSAAADDGPDSRTAGERRADALTALVLGTATDDGHPVRVTADVQVAIPLDQLLSLRDPEAAVGAEVAGLSLLLADPAIACTLRPVITDPDGHVLDAGRRRYALPAALRRLIIARDRTCRFPGCGRSAQLAEIDHARAWTDGGASDAANLGALCTRHHQLKTLAGWQITHSWIDGTCTWRSPAGYRYDHDPPPF